MRTEYIQIPSLSKYPLNKHRLDRIHRLIDKAYNTMTLPLAAHFVIHWHEKTSVTVAREAIYKALKLPFLFAAVNELSDWQDHETGEIKGNHCHLLIVYDGASLNHKTKATFHASNTIRPMLAGLLDGVARSVSHKPNHHNRPVHDVKLELEDTKVRFSYMAKKPTSLLGKDNFSSSCFLDA